MKKSLTILLAGLAAASLLLSGCSSKNKRKMPERLTAPETTQAPETTEALETEATTAEESTAEAAATGTASAEKPDDIFGLFTEDASLPAVNLPRDPNGIIDLSTNQYTYNKMIADLDYLYTCYPDYMSIRTIGTTHDGRDIPVVVFGNKQANAQILICAATHAREYMTTQLVMKQLEYYCANYETGTYGETTLKSIFENTCFIIVPMVNPDGVSIAQLGEDALNREDLCVNLRAIYASDVEGGYTDLSYASWLSHYKANAMGVDLNRNYSPGWDTLSDRHVPSSSLYPGSAPGSEPETQALMTLVNSLDNCLLAVSCHSYGNLVYWQYGQEEPMWTVNENLATHISNLTGVALGEYSNEAGFSNWLVLEKGIPSVTLEVGSVSCPLPIEEFQSIWNAQSMLWPMLGAIYGTH